MASRELEKAALPIRVLELRALLRAYNVDYISRKDPPHGARNKR